MNNAERPIYRYPIIIGNGQQGESEQNITPELELSIQLRDSCEKLLQDKGENSFSFRRMLHSAPLESVDILYGIDGSVDKPVYRQVVLKGRVDKGEKMILVTCDGIKPEKAKSVDIYSLYEQDYRDLWKFQSREWLRLRKNKKGVYIVEERRKSIAQLALVNKVGAEELLSYQKLINESSPIEEK